MLDNQLQTLIYDSDHRALLIKIDNSSLNSKVLPAKKNEGRYLYKATNWSKFSKALDTSKIEDIPQDRKLGSEEIDAYLTEMTKAIQQTIEQQVPKIRKQNSVDIYIYQSKHHWVAKSKISAANASKQNTKIPLTRSLRGKTQYRTAAPENQRKPDKRI